ncbi:phage head-tail connector protein [Aneurinibacillus sp. Ricciae_BoGa-3]|uniref:phage head-tail connector protein n=1 Tax=Aneurinibacillus sp. Ricciae_BoGa-3 TaxID=3022697 RepID=UPI0023410475|nr:phage head-tail connector protein [Aneurinibacillus sp. Ricciae_BoGa-3]WCK55136.1 phage head-tail connector protein [Aneurinibacillus sp. Ricciae_BoGa-3]
MNDPLSLVKILLQIDSSDTSNDVLLNFYLTKAKNAILKYCVMTEEDYFAVDLTNQTAELALYFYQNKKSLGLKDMTEGTRSKTYIEEAIPPSIWVTLPLPNIVLS